jgi:hypothetical protein
LTFGPSYSRLTYLRPNRVRFCRQGDTLSLTVQETEGPGLQTHYPRVVLRSCFPVSEEGAYLSVRDVSPGQEVEIGILEDWEALEKDDRRAVATELGLHYFVPRIERVLKVKEELGFLYWTVDTDRGRKEFVMRNSVIRYAREVSPGHWLLIDVNEARYEIADVNRLDRASQQWVRRFLYL